MKFMCLPFYQLSLDQLYEIMVARQKVFVVEQNCPYLDADGLDQSSWHVMAYEDSGKLMAYTRLVPKGLNYQDYVSIGRVISSREARGTGLGKKIMALSIEKCREVFGEEPIKISAQSYLVKFYKDFGFTSVGESYLEDDIPHQAMVLE